MMQTTRLGSEVLEILEIYDAGHAFRAYRSEMYDYGNPFYFFLFVLVSQ